MDDTHTKKIIVFALLITCIIFGTWWWLNKQTDRYYYNDIPSQQVFNQLLNEFGRELINSENNTRRVRELYLQKIQEHLDKLSHIEDWRGRVKDARKENGTFRKVGDILVAVPRMSYVVEMRNSDNTVSMFFICRLDNVSGVWGRTQEQRHIEKAKRHFSSKENVLWSGEITRLSNGDMEIYYDGNLGGFAVVISPKRIVLEKDAKK